MTCPGFESIETYEGESFGPVTIMSYQRYKFRLYRIASSITRNIYQRSGATLSEVVSAIKAVNGRLRQWERSIPRELRLKHLKTLVGDQHTQKTIRIFQLQALVLQLSYDNIQLVLHRPLLTMNRVPSWPLNDPDPVEKTTQRAPGDTADEINDMIKTSKYQSWVSSVRTSMIGEYAEVLSASQNTHGAAYVGIQSFTAGVVLGIFALSDPLSDQALQAKRAVSRIIKLPRLHEYRTNVSDQCGAILEELLRLVLAEEMKALLVEGALSTEATTSDALQDAGVPGNDLGFGSVAENSHHHFSVVGGFDERVSTVPEPIEPDTSAFLSRQGPDIPQDIDGGNFSDALVSLQDGMTDHFPLPWLS